MLYSSYSRQPAVLWLTNNSPYFRQRSATIPESPYQSLNSSLVGLKLMLSVKFTIFFAGGIMCAQDYKLKFTFEVVVWALKTIFWKKQWHVPCSIGGYYAIRGRWRAPPLLAPWSIFQRLFHDFGSPHWQGHIKNLIYFHMSFLFLIVIIPYGVITITHSHFVS